MLLFSAVPSCHSAQDDEEENPMPVLEKQASSAKNSQVLTLEDFQRIFQDTMKALSLDPGSRAQPPLLAHYADTVPSPQDKDPMSQLVTF